MDDHQQEQFSQLSPEAITKAYAYCQQKAAQSGSTFYYSFLFLPPKKRCAITALYAFCREVDDIVDEHKERSVARTKLNWWREEITRLYAGNPQHPITQTLAIYMPITTTPQHLFLDLIDGMEMDLDISRYPSFRELELYCYRAAGTVGLLITHIMDYNSPQTFTGAKKFGIALQLINIIRDVGEDIRRHRIYLPTDEMERFNVQVKDLQEKQPNAAVQQLLAFQAERAKTFYREALATLHKENQAKQMTSLIMGDVYYQLLLEIERDNFAVLDRRITLTPIRKLWIAWCVYRKAKKGEYTR